jgi:hypothetical protein
MHEHEGAFIGLTFRTDVYFWWIDATGAMPEQPRYTREAAAAVLLPRAERAAARVIPGSLWTRAGEEQVGLRREDAGDCATCGKQLAEGMFRWTDQTPEPEDYFPPFPDDGRFPDLRHADGDKNHGVHFGPDVKAACPECLRPGLDFKDTGYGWNANCPHCGWRKYTDSGD